MKTLHLHKSNFINFIMEMKNGFQDILVTVQNKKKIHSRLYLIKVDITFDEVEFLKYRNRHFEEGILDRTSSRNNHIVKIRTFLKILFHSNRNFNSIRINTI